MIAQQMTDGRWTDTELSFKSGCCLRVVNVNRLISPQVDLGFYFTVILPVCWTNSEPVLREAPIGEHEHPGDQHTISDVHAGLAGVNIVPRWYCNDSQDSPLLNVAKADVSDLQFNNYLSLAPARSPITKRAKQFQAR